MKINIERLTALSWESNLYVFLFVIALFCGQSKMLSYVPHIMIVLIGISIIESTRNGSILLYKHRNILAVLVFFIAIYIGVQAWFWAYNPSRTMVYFRRYFLYSSILLFSIKKDLLENILFYAKKYSIIAGLSGALMMIVTGTKSGGLFGTYHAVGMMMSIACCLFAVEYFTSDQKRLALTKYLISLLCVIVSTKRMFLFLSIASFFLVYLITTDRKKSFKLIKAIAYVMFAVIVIFIVVPQTQVVLIRFQEMLSEEETVQLSGRNVLWKMAVSIFNSYPIGGVGFSNFIDYSGSFFSNPWAGKFHTHSIYYGLLCETGIVGCVLFGLLFITGLVSSIRCLIKCRRHSDKDGENRMIQSIVLQAWFLVYGLSGNGIYDVNVFLWYIFALMILKTVNRDLLYCDL